MPAPHSHHYEVVMQRRVPNATGGGWPTLTIMGPITPKDRLAFTRELFSDGGFIVVSCDPTDLTKYPDILQSLRDPYTYPAELVLYRDGVIVQQGPIVATQVQGPTITINARGLLYYLRYMIIESDLKYKDVDQYSVVVDLIDRHQDQTYGNFGIDTSGIGLSGTLITKEFDRDRGLNVFGELDALAQRENGFDYYYTYDSNRDLVLAAKRGTDKSATVFLDSRGILSPQIAMSVAAGEVCSVLIAAGNDTKKPTIYTNVYTHTKVVAFGRAHKFEAFDGVSVAATLTEYANSALATYERMIFTPGAIAHIPVQGADPVTDYDVGDTVTWTFDAGLGLQTYTLDVSYLGVSVGGDGQEEVTVEFL